MPLPNLIHPVDVTVLKSDKANSFFDSDAREPIRTVRRTSVTFKAQVSMRGTSSSPDFGGLMSERVRGYLLTRVTDLASATYTPSIGDKITKIGHRDVELYVLQREDLGHYPGANGATLVKIYFEDRRPASDNPSMIRGNS